MKKQTPNKKGFVFSYAMIKLALTASLTMAACWTRGTTGCLLLLSILLFSLVACIGCSADSHEAEQCQFHQ